MEPICIQQDGTKLKLILNPNMRNGHTMYLYWECGQEWYAELLAKRCRDVLGDTLKAIREEEYNAGWRDAKSKKKPKRNWFSPFCGVR